MKNLFLIVSALLLVTITSGQSHQRYYSPEETFTSLDSAIKNRDKVYKLVLRDPQFYQSPSWVEGLTDLSTVCPEINLPSRTIDQFQNLESLELSVHEFSDMESLFDKLKKLKNLKELTLSINFDVRLPQALNQLKELEELHIFGGFNHIILPDSLNNLQNLVLLDFRSNLIFELPESIFQLRRLESLTLVTLSVPQLPASFSNLTRLSNFTLHSKLVTTIPEEIGQLPSLNSLFMVVPSVMNTNIPKSIINAVSRIKHIEIQTSGSTFSNLEEKTQQNFGPHGLPVVEPVIYVNPADAEKIKKRLHIDYLDLKNQDLTALPDSVSFYTQLKKLDVSNNRLSALPKDLSSLNTLTSLNLEANQLKALPYSIQELVLLEYLNLKNNKLENLTHWWVFNHLSNLKVLELEGNKLKHLPYLQAPEKLEYLGLKNNHFSEEEIKRIKRLFKHCTIVFE